VDINGKMGGYFLQMLTDAFDHHNADKSYTLDRAVFDAVSKLTSQPDGFGQKYGPRALLFGLIGNGKLKVCVPHGS
jgi:hypothetical protein